MVPPSGPERMKPTESDAPRHTARAGEGQALGRNLGLVLVSDGLITEDQFAAVLAQQRETGEKLSGLVVRLGYISKEHLAEFLSRKYHIPLVALPDTAISPDMLGRRRVPEDYST